jgi:hypothetical protein
MALICVIVGEIFLNFAKKCKQVSYPYCSKDGAVIIEESDPPCGS